MYDLNLTVPNLTSKKYSDDNRFLLLKNYLYELNETLVHALSEKEQQGFASVSRLLENEGKKQQSKVQQLQSQTVSHFKELKEKILRTAEEIEKDYSSAISQSEQKIMQSVTGEFVAKSEFGEYKGAVDTRLEQTAEELKLTAENIDMVNSDIESLKDETKSQFTLQAEAITSQVESLYTTKNDTAELESRIESQITQTADGITESFSKSLVAVDEEISSVGGELNEFISDLDVYIRRGELEGNVYGIEIGRSDSNVKARFTNDRLSFYQGIVEVAYISGSNLYITNAEFLDRFKIGNTETGWFEFDTTENGLEVRWINGG